MKLRTFNTETYPVHATKGRKNRMLLTVGVGGVFRFNQATVEVAKLKLTDSVAFYQDEENPADWYVQFKPEQDGYPFQATKGKLTCVAFAHKGLAERLRHTVGLDGTFTVPLGGYDKKANTYALLTKAAQKAVPTGAGHKITPVVPVVEASFKIEPPQPTNDRFFKYPPSHRDR